jgi:hypothetical protein
VTIRSGNQKRTGKHQILMILLIQKQLKIQNTKPVIKVDWLRNTSSTFGTMYARNLSCFPVSGSEKLNVFKIP